MEKQVGFIGFGTMGSGMVRNLVKKGFEVLAYNRTPVEEKIENVTFVRAIADVATAKTVFLCVSDDLALEAVLFGDDGLLHALTPGTLLVDSSTTSVPMTERIAAACEKKNVNFLNAPVTGSKKGADTGTLLFMVGGKRETLDAAMPVFQAMGTRFVYCGEGSAGARAKITLNVTQAMILESYLEGLLLGRKEGVPLDAILEIFDNSGVRNNVGDVTLPNIRKRDFSPRFKHRLMHKDLKLAEQEIERLQLALPLAAHIRGVFEEALVRGDEDFTTIVKTLEKKAGLTLE